MSPVEEINSLVVGAAESLARCLHEYWPVVNPNTNGLQEANLSTHLSSQAMNFGFFAYPEASNAVISHGHSRLDLLLLSPKIAVLVEAKKLYSAEKTEELVADFEKSSGSALLMMTKRIPRWRTFPNMVCCLPLRPVRQIWSGGISHMIGIREPRGIN